MYDNHQQFKSFFVYNIETMIMQFVPFIRKSISVIWKLIVEMKIINIYCLVLDMINEFIDIGIQTLLMMWISYCQQKVLLYGTHVYSLDAQTMLQNTIKYLIFQFTQVNKTLKVLLRYIIRYISLRIPITIGGI